MTLSKVSCFVFFRTSILANTGVGRSTVCQVWAIKPFIWLQSWLLSQLKVSFCYSARITFWELSNHLSVGLLPLPHKEWQYLATIIVLMLRPLASAGRLASLNSGFLINCHCWGKMRPTSREQWDNEGGGEWMVWDGARARQEFAQGAIPLLLLPPPPPPISGNTATARENCTPTIPWLDSFGIIQCPKWLDWRLPSSINYCQYHLSCLGKINVLTKCAGWIINGSGFSVTARAHLAFWFVLSSKEDVSISCENLIWRTSPSSDKYDRRYDGIIIPG